MPKKPNESELNPTKKRNIGIAVAFILALGLIGGIASLSVKPAEYQGEGLAQVKFFSRDGTQVNASNLDLNLYVCNASGVEDELVLAYYANFSNYDAVVLNSTYFEGLELQYEIPTDHVALLQIENGTYGEDWAILKPEEQSIILNEIPDTVMMTQLITLQNSTSNYIEGVAFIQCVKIVDDLYVFDHANCSILGYYDDYSQEERVYLYMKIDAAANYTSAAMNLTLGETTLYQGDLYVKINGDIAPGCRFDFQVDGSEYGTPDLSIGYVVGDDLTTFSQILEVLTS